MLMPLGLISIESEEIQTKRDEALFDFECHRSYLSVQIKKKREITILHIPVDYEGFETCGKLMVDYELLKSCGRLKMISQP